MLFYIYFFLFTLAFDLFVAFVVVVVIVSFLAFCCQFSVFLLISVLEQRGGGGGVVGGFFGLRGEGGEIRLIKSHTERTKFFIGRKKAASSRDTLVLRKSLGS